MQHMHAKAIIALHIKQEGINDIWLSATDTDP